MYFQSFTIPLSFSFALRPAYGAMEQESARLLREQHTELQLEHSQLLQQTQNLQAQITSLQSELESRALEAAQASRENEALVAEMEHFSQSLIEHVGQLVAVERRERSKIEHTLNATCQELEAVKELSGEQEAQIQQLKRLLFTQNDNSSKEIAVPIERYASLMIDEANEAHLQTVIAGNSRLWRKYCRFWQNKTQEMDAFLQFFYHLDIEATLKGSEGTLRMSARKLFDSLVRGECTTERLVDISAFEGWWLEVEREEEGDSSSLNGSFLEILLPYTTEDQLDEEKQDSAPRKHGLCGVCGCWLQVEALKFQISLSAQDCWFPMCSYCRERLVAVGNFIALLHSAERGAFQAVERERLYVRILHARREMFLAKTASLVFFAANDERIYKGSASDKV